MECFLAKQNSFVPRCSRSRMISRPTKRWLSPCMRHLQGKRSTLYGLFILFFFYAKMYLSCLNGLITWSMCAHKKDDSCSLGSQSMVLARVLCCYFTGQLLDPLFAMASRHSLVTCLSNLNHKLITWLRGLGKLLGWCPRCASGRNPTAWRQELKITRDSKHIWHKEYVLVPSGRRYKLTNCRSNRYKFFLVSILITVLNSKNLV